MDESKAKTYKVTVSFELEISPDDLKAYGEDGEPVAYITPTDYADLFVEDAFDDLLDDWDVESVIELTA